MGRAYSNRFNVTVTAPTGPTWRLGQAVNEWREISGSAMSLAVPSVTQIPAVQRPAKNIMETWNGFAIDTRNDRILALGPGGHGDQEGNEVWDFRGGANSPAWNELLAATLYSQSWVDAGFPPQARHWDDSTRLTGSHTYYSHHIIKAHNRLVRAYTGSVCSGAGTGFGTTDSYDITAAQGVNGTDPDGTYPLVLAGTSSTDSFGQQGPATCQDPGTEEIYLFRESTPCRKLTPNVGSTPGGTWANAGTFPPAGFSGLYAASAFDTVRKRILVIKNFFLTTRNRYWSFDTLTNTYTEITSLMNSGAARDVLDLAMSCPGMIYEPELDAYLVRLGEISGRSQTPVPGRVLMIDAASWAVSELTTTGGDSIPEQADLSGDPGNLYYENVFSKWLYSPNLGGCFLFTKYDQPARFFRTH